MGLPTKYYSLIEAELEIGFEIGGDLDLDELKVYARLFEKPFVVLRWNTFRGELECYGSILVDGLVPLSEEQKYYREIEILDREQLEIDTVELLEPDEEDLFEITESTSSWADCPSIHRRLNNTDLGKAIIFESPYSIELDNDDLYVTREGLHLIEKELARQLSAIDQLKNQIDAYLKKHKNEKKEVRIRYVAHQIVICAKAIDQGLITNGRPPIVPGKWSDLNDLFQSVCPSLMVRGSCKDERQNSTQQFITITTLKSYIRGKKSGGSKVAPLRIADTPKEFNWIVFFSVPAKVDFGIYGDKAP